MSVTAADEVLRVRQECRGYSTLMAQWLQEQSPASFVAGGSLALAVWVLLGQIWVNHHEKALSAWL